MSASKFPEYIIGQFECPICKCGELILGYSPDDELTEEQTKMICINCKKPMNRIYVSHGTKY